MLYSSSSLSDTAACGPLTCALIRRVAILPAALSDFCLGATATDVAHFCLFRSLDARAASSRFSAPSVIAFTMTGSCIARARTSTAYQHNARRTEKYIYSIVCVKQISCNLDTYPQLLHPLIVSANSRFPLQLVCTRDICIMISVLRLCIVWLFHRNILWAIDSWTLFWPAMQKWLPEVAPGGPLSAR